MIDEMKRCRSNIMVAMNIKKTLCFCGMVTFLSMPLIASAAPGTLADSPLFLSTSVEPNIFWTVDDSGSMDWEMLVSGGTSGLPYIGSWGANYYILPSANNDYDAYYISTYTWYPYTLASEGSLSGAWMSRNSSYNVLYYNPEVTYSPWAGTDAVGSPMFSDATPGAALVDPTDASKGTLDLDSSMTYKCYTPSLGGWHDDTIYPAKYYTWTDDGDGVVESTDTHTLVEIKSANAPFTGGAGRTDCALAPSCTYDEEIQNFANWYQYYRKREYVAKAAIGNLIQGNSSARMGLQVFNDGLISSVASMSGSADKIALLNNTYGLSMPCLTSSCPGTPARSSLKSVGDLFEGGSSPILASGSGGSCQQNFNILLSDGYWNGSSPSVGNTDGGTSDSSFDSGDYADSYSDTLADVAMHYYERDLKTSIDNNVPTTPGVDEADHQHLVTYSVAFGLTGTLDSTIDDPTDPTFSWTNPASGDAQKVDDLWHTAYNGRGVYLSAQDPAQLTSSLATALDDIDDRAGSAAAVAFNTNTLTTGSAVFLVLFNSNRWSGSIYKYPLDPVTGAVSETMLWEASAVIDARDLSSDPRQIITHDGSTGLAFQWSTITTAQKNDLKTNAAGGADSDTIGEARLDYIRGDRSSESTGYNFRTRSSRFGDIVHSNPVYVGAPSMDWPNTAPFPVDALGTDPAIDTYTEWKATAVSSRTSMLYVGSNDGMMHGIRTSDGAEMFAYIPTAVFSTSSSAGLHYLTDPTYIHKYYVDLSPTISDAYVKVDPAGSEAWRTLLIGGQRAGGKSIYALDVTDPTALTEANAADIVLWEFTDADLGYTYSEPTVVMTNNNKWAVIFGNGYNDSGSGEAQLYILYIEDGLDGWAAGDYVKITTGSDCSGGGNGLSTPAVVDLDANGTADRVYAGDLCGDMWAFDLSDASDSNWDVAYKHGSTPKPLFDGVSTQPITVEPLVAEHPTETGGSAPNLMVYFGTGQYLISGDKTTTSTQAFYGVWDEGTKELDTSNLVEQTLESNFASDERVLTNTDVPYDLTGGSKRYGWYFELPTSGERVVVNPSMRGDIVYYNTLIPSNDPCTYGGSGWLMAVDADTGGRPDADNQVFDINGDGTVNAADLLTNSDDSVVDQASSGTLYGGGIPAESSFLGDYQYTPGTDTDDGSDIQVNKIQGLGDSSTGRLSWEEIPLE